LLAMRLPDWSILEMMWPASRAPAVSDILAERANAIVGQRIVRIREVSGWSMVAGSEGSEAALHSPWARVDRDGDSGWLLTATARSQALNQRLFSDHFVVACLVGAGFEPSVSPRRSAQRCARHPLSPPGR
jgi:hypothetical protein